VGISARVIQAVLGVGDTAPPMPSGVNLPNSSWIRQKHGSKSVSLGNIMAAQDAANRDNGVLEEFAAGKREVERAKAHGALAHALLVDMHEVIGHASGKLAPGVAEASETLRQYAGTLEEGRADLVALYYILDPKLVALKVMPSLEVGRSAYDAYIRGGLLVQLARIPLGENIEEAHMRNRQLIARWAYEQGKPDNVIELLERDGKTYAVVNDYVRLRKLFGQLLNEIQRIKSEGDFESARDLVESHGVRVDPKLHAQVRERYQSRKVAPYAGFIQPELVPVKKGDEIVDVRIEYPTDFVAQQLRYAARYSFLPTYN
jgi:dipeptidyl-peptidase-3